MVKLSDVIRKAKELKVKDKTPFLSEAFRMKGNKPDLVETKKIYEAAILSLKPIMNDLQMGKRVHGKGVSDIAGILVNQLRMDRETLLSLLNIFAFLGEKDDYIYSHSVNASVLASGLAFSLGYDGDELVDLCASSLLHDIGLLRVPRDIITKPAALTQEEFELIKKHPAHGLDLLTNIKDPPKFSPEIIYQHHERINGTGYPEGKRGEDISEPAQVMAIIEAYEAITHPRPYRKEKNIPYAGVRMVVEESRRSFSPRLVKRFLNFMTPYPLGSFVLLNNGEIGRVIHLSENQPLRPVIEIFFDSRGKPPESPKRTDLSKSPVLCIEKAINDSYL